MAKIYRIFSSNLCKFLETIHTILMVTLTLALIEVLPSLIYSSSPLHCTGWMQLWSGAILEKG